jgi:hypothetical protein
MISSSPHPIGELLAITIDHDCVRVQRREPAELAVDQPKASDHVVNGLERPVTQADVLVDRSVLEVSTMPCPDSRRPPS